MGAKKRLLRWAKQTANSVLVPLGEEIRSAYHPLVPEAEAYKAFNHRRPTTPRLVNIGAGRFQHPVWHNLDFVTANYKAYLGSNVHLPHNLASTAPLPLANDSLQAAYTSHVIEHLNNAHVAHMFQEVYRALAPGGIFRVTAPDMALALAAYRAGSAWFFDTPHFPGNTSLPQRFLERFISMATTGAPQTEVPKATDEAIVEAFSTLPDEAAFDRFLHEDSPEHQNRYANMHRNWFTETKTERMLREAGFETVYASRFGQSRSKYMVNTNHFDTTKTHWSFYMEAIK